MKDATLSSARLLELYDRISDTEDAIPRLRRLVLDLAVRGKLVEQDAGDEPADELVKRIAKLSQPSAGRRGKSRDTSVGNSLEDEPFELPNGWTIAPLGQLVRVLNGRAYKKQELLDAGTPVLRVGNLFTSNHWYYSDLELDEDKHCDAGDLIYAWSASFGPFIWDGPRAIFHYHIWKLPLVSEADLDKLYLYNFLLQKTREIKEQGRGISMVHMTKEKMLKLVVPLPPLAEQHRIVAKVDELMALCDQLEQARAGREAVRDRLTTASLARLTAPDTDAQALPEEVGTALSSGNATNTSAFQSHARFALQSLATLTTRPDQIKALRQTILNLAVRGKLVAQDAADEPAAELLKRFKAGKDALKKETGDARIKLAPDANRESYPLDLPLGWEVQSFENLFLFIDYRGNTPPKTEGGVPLITAKNVRMGTLNREPREYISEQTFEKWMTRGFPRLGDLFFTTEAPLANVCLNDIEEPFALAQRVICFQPYATIDTRYLMLALTSDVMQGLIDGEATGMTAKGIKAAKLKPLPIPLPPLAEQHRIVAKVDALMALCDQLEASLTTTATTRSKLLNALLHEALEPAAETADA